MSSLNIIELYVTDIQKEGILLKIFGQNDRDASVFVEKMLIQFTENSGNKHIDGIPMSKNDLYRGMLCCARFDDGIYYRAKVKDLSSLLPPNIVTLSFIDYGNTRNVDLSDIRLINNCELLLKVEELAVDYYLAEVMPPHKDWEDSTIEFIKEKLNYVELKCQILSEVCGKKLVRIYVNNVDFKQILIQHSLALQIPLQVQQNMIQQVFAGNREIPKQFTVPPPNIVMSIPPSQRPVISHLPRNLPPPALNIVPTSIPPPSISPNLYPLPRHGVPAEFHRKISAPTPEPQHFVCDVLQPGSTHYVYISHVEDGPVSFAVQLKAFAENELTKLMAELNDHEPKPISGPLIPGSSCLGRFSEDQSLCRASIMHVMDDKCKVYYVDYGNSEVLPYSQIYEIPPKYLSMQVMATRFTLSGTRNTQYTNEIKDYFKQLVTDKLLFLKVTPTEGNPLKQYCELFLDGQNVKDLLLEKIKQIPLVYAKVHPPIKGTKEQVIVSFVENVQKLFVQFEENKMALKSLMANLGILCNSGRAAQLTHDRLFAGLPCCALYSGDQLWYRAQVLSVIRDAANILFVDYGNQETVPTTALREITRELVTELRPQALQCSLSGFQEGSDRDQALTSRLDELAAENSFTMVVVDVLSNQTAVVDLINNENVSLATLLSPPIPSRLSSSSYSSESSSFDQGGKKNKVGGRPEKGQQRLGNSTKKQNHQQQPHFQQQQIPRSLLKGAKDRFISKRDNEEFSKKPVRPGFDRPRGFDDGGTGRRFKINERRRDDVSYDRNDDTTGNWKHKERDRKEENTSSWKNRDRGDWKEDNTNSWKNRDRGDWKEDNTRNWKNKDNDRKEENTASWKNKDRDWKGDGGRSWKNKDNDWKTENAGSWKNKDNDWKAENAGSWKSKDNDWKAENAGSWKNKDREDNSSGSWKHKERDRKDDNMGDNWKHKEKDWSNKDREEGRGGGNFGKRGRGGDNWGNKFSDKENDSQKTFGEDEWGTKQAKDTSFGRSSQYGKQNRDYNQHGKFNRDGSDSSGGDFSRNKFESKDSDGFKFNSGRDNFRRGGGGRDGGGDTGGGGFKQFNRDRDDRFAGKKVSPRDTSFVNRIESTAPMLSIPLHSISVGCCETVEPVSTVSPHEFYVQVDSSIDKLDELQKTIADTYGSGGGETLERLKKRMPCIAQFSEDEVWYRGVIETVYANSVSVIFVDYGNKEDVKVDNVKVISSELCDLPRQAIKCSLYGSKPLLGEWSEEESQLFMDTVLSKKLKAQFVGKTFLSNALEVVVTDIESGININTMFGASEEFVTEAVEKMRTVELKDLPIQEGATEEIQITWFISPSQFYVQPLSTHSEFRAMVESMQEVAKCGRPVPTSALQVGDLVIARYKEDKVLYRAKVKETGLSPVVQYVDYGNHEKVESGNIWCLDPEYAQIPIQAVSCSLAGIMPVEETWPMNSNIDSYFDAERFSCTFLSQLDSASQVYSVKLVSGENDVAEQLLANSLAMEEKEQSDHVEMDAGENNEIELGLLAGQQLCIKVCHVESGQKFYVHLLPAFADSVQEQINKAIAEKQNVEPLMAEQITCGTLCLTLCRDNCYYRSKIIDPSVPIVQFIDIGSVHQTSFDEVFNNLEEFSKIPAQATECALSCSADGLPQDLEPEFKTDIEDKTFIIYVDAVQNETLHVKLFDRSGEVLEKFQLGLKEQVEPLEPICPLPILRSHQKVYIVAANDSGIYLQKTEHSDIITELLDNLYDFYNATEYTEHEWTAGMLCCALSDVDSQWYRARIISIEDSNCNIHYIDYGNNEMINVINLRKLDSKFYDPHMLAVCVTFHVEWVVPMETIMELVGSKEYNAVILKNNGNWIAELMDLNGHSLTEKLVELGFVTALDNSPFARVVEGGRFVEGSTIRVTVSHVDSPSQIWLHVNGDVDIVEALQDRLQEAVLRLKKLDEPPSPPSLFAAIYTDDMWYRAIHLHDNVVRYIDYGNTGNIDISDIKELSAEFLEPSEGYAVKCELFVEPKDVIWSDDVIDRLQELLLSNSVEERTAHVLAVKESSILVDLRVDGVSVSDVLVNENFGDRPLAMITGYVCHMNSLDSFYIQQQSCEGELTEIAESLLSADNFEFVSNPAGQVGQIIAAKYPVDDQWYRAKILDVSDDGVTVVFVDYGNCGVATEFKILPEELANKECLAKHCALKKPTTIDEWPETAVEKFNELVAGGSTTFTIKVMSKGDPDIVILTHNDQSVALELSMLCKIENEEHTTSIILSEIPSLSVVVTHVNSPTDFYVQYKSSENDVIDISEKLKDVINSDPVILNEENMNKVLAAQSSVDRQWYRVRIVQNKQTEVEVFLIDYGRRCSSTKLRQLPQSLENKPPLAVHCSLKIPGCSETACEKFKELVENSDELYMELIEEEEYISIVNLYGNNECDIRQYLLKSCHSALPFDYMEDEDSDSPDFLTGFIMHVNSLNDFYIHENGIDVIIDDLMEKLSAVNDAEPLKISDISVGTVVAAKHSESNSWHRAKVVKKCDNKITVLYIDYGNSEVSTNFRTLPPEFSEVKPLALHCSLQYPEGVDRWSEEANELFFDLASGGVNAFEYKIIEQGEPNIITLLTDGNSVEEMLSKFNHEEIDINTITDIRRDIGSNLVYVSHINDPSSFYIQYKEHENRLEEMADSLSVADVFNTADNIVNGDVVATECPVDGVWYRGKVVEQNNNEIRVLCIDYGKISSTSNVRELPVELIKKQPLAKHCCLQIPDHISNWSEHAKKEFKKFIENGNVEFQLKIIAEGNPASVDLISSEGSLSEILAKLSDEGDNKKSDHCYTEDELNSKDFKNNVAKDDVCDIGKSAVVYKEINASKETTEIEHIGESDKLQETPEKKQIDENDALQKTPERKQVEENITKQKTPDKEHTEENVMQQKTPEKEYTEENVTQQKTPEKEQTEENVTQQKTPEKKQIDENDGLQKTPERKQVEENISKQKTPEKEHTEENVMQQKTQEKEQTEENVMQQKTPEKEQTEENVMQPKTPVKEHTEENVMQQKTPEKEHTEENVTQQKTPEKKQIDENDGLQKTPERKQVEENITKQKSPEKEHTKENVMQQKTPEKEQTEENVMQQKTPEKEQTEENVIQQKTPEKEQTEENVTQQKTPEKKQIDENDALQKTPERKQVEENITKQKTPEKEHTEENVMQQKSLEKKLSEETEMDKNQEVIQTEENTPQQNAPEVKENVTQQTINEPQQQSSDSSIVQQHVENIPST